MGSPMTRMSGMRLDRLGGVGLGLRVLKTGLACALAWVLAERLFADGLPVLAPLAALLTVQVTVHRSVTFGLQRAVQVPVSALLVLALSGPSHLSARERVLETLLGGAVAVVVNLLVVPPLFTRSADQRLAALAAGIAGLLEDRAGPRGR